MDNLHHCDNLQLMKSLPNDSIDFIYIDPPFFTQRTHKSKKGSFEDSWSSLNEFIIFLDDRFVECRRLLKDTGVFCLHLDYRTVHHARIFLDEVFGYKNFINEVIWCYKSGGSSKRRLSNKHDTILIYSKTKEYTYNPLKEKSYLSGNGQFPDKKYYEDDKGIYGLVNLKDWFDIGILSTTANERTGYPTQKPIKLLDRLIKSFSNEGDLVADFFCGSGTTLKSAQNLNRKWLGCDANIDAINICKNRLRSEDNE